MVQSSEVKDAAALAAEFEARAAEFIELTRGLDEEQWLLVTEAESWPVGTTVHHVAQSIGSTWQVAEAMMAGNAPDIGWDQIHASNAAHAAEYPNPDKAETLALLENGARDVAAKLAALSAEQIDHPAVLPAFGPDPIPTRLWIEMVVIGHFGIHGQSIEATIGR